MADISETKHNYNQSTTYPTFIVNILQSMIVVVYSTYYKFLIYLMHMGQTKTSKWNSMANAQ